MEVYEKMLAAKGSRESDSVEKAAIHFTYEWVVFNIINVAYDELNAKGPEVMKLFGLFGQPQLAGKKVAKA